MQKDFMKLNMSFSIKNAKFLKKYKEICDKIRNSINKNFDSS